MDINSTLIGKKEAENDEDCQLTDLGQISKETKGNIWGGWDGGVGLTHGIDGVLEE